MHKNKASLVEVLHQTIGCTKADAERGVDAILDTIINTLKDGGEVSVAGLGIFSVKQRKARTARNPKTGAPVQVPEMRVPKFRAAKAFKDSVK